MSSDQAFIDEFVTAKDLIDDTNVPSWSPKDEDKNGFSVDECQNCGNSVTLQYRRVFGSNDDIVFGCPDCTTFREQHNGGVAHE